MWQRLAANWRLLLVLAFGILVAATLLAVSPVYTRVMNDLGLQEALDRQIGSASRNGAFIGGNRLGDVENGQRARELAQIMSEEVGWFTQYEVRFGALPPMTLAREGQPAPTGRDRPLIAVQTLSGIDEHVTIVEGRAARPTSSASEIEVLMPIEAARFLNLEPGHTVQAAASFDDCNRPPPSEDPEQARELALFACTPQTFVDLRATFTVVGFVERLDAGDRYWSAGNVSFNTPRPTDEQGPIVTVILPEQSFFQALPGALPRFRSDFRLTGFADVARLNSGNIGSAQQSLERLRVRIDQVGAIPDLAMAGPLNAFQNRASFNQISLLLLLIQVVGIAIYYVVLVSTLLAERRSEEIAMLRSRGASVGQLVAMSMAEAFAIGLAAAFVAPFVASGAVAALGKTGTFESISGGSFLPFTLVPAAFLFALGGAAIAAIATVIPAFFAARKGMVLFLRSSARPGTPFLQRYYLDVGLVGASALALWQMSQRGSVFDARSVGGWSADPFLLMSPLLLILAIGALMFRFMPLVLGLVTRLLARTAGPGVTLGLWQLTRSPARYTQLALLVVMAAAVGTFAATYGETTDRSQEERALYAVGADMRLTGLGNLGVNFDEAVQRLEEVDGIDKAVTAFRNAYTVGPLPNFGARIDVLGLDPLEASEVLWFREDFAPDDLRSLLLRISGSPVPEQGIAMPGVPVSVSAWVNPLEARLGTTLWVRTVDGRGVFRFHELGTLDYTGYRKLEAPIRAQQDAIVFPLSVVALIMTQSESISDPARRVLIDDLGVMTASGEEIIIEDFEGNPRWEVLHTATRNQDEVQIVGQNAHSGNGAALFSFLTGTSAGLRGMHVGHPNIPLPAIASRQLMESAGLRVGAQIDLVFGKLLVPVTIQGVTDYFPTMYNSGAGYLIINQDHLYYYAGMTSENYSNTRPSELWLNVSKDPEERRAVQTALLDRFSIPSGQVIDTEFILEEIRTDPVVRAGGSGILLLALVAAFAILALGFALTLYLGGQSRTVEVSVMRAVGISPRQLFTMISLEYLLIAVIGLVIGTIAGLRISDTMLSFLNVTESGARVVPPFALVTRWDTVGIAFGLVGLSFIAGVVALAFYFLRLPVSRVIRMTR
jgi:hypothetical protein